MVRPPSRQRSRFGRRRVVTIRLNADHDSLADVAAVVRRTLAARTRDQHLVEDLTQETLARLADSEHRLPPDEQRAYAVVTARNLLASHYRGQSVRGRHLHRLVEHGGPDDPAQVTVDKEETDALTSALSQLPTIERDLLVRHEVGGTDLATLAGEANVSSGAIAMRLARARASLRLEFLLAFRRLELPTDRCRPVLLALAVGDRRRQAQLDADAHVAECPACAELVAPMTGRDRRIAGWLLIPIAEGLRRAWRALRAHPVQAASGALTVAATGALFVAGRSAGDDAAPATTAPVIVSVPATGDAPAAPARDAVADGPATRRRAPALTLPAVAGDAAACAGSPSRDRRPGHRPGVAVSATGAPRPARPRHGRRLPLHRVGRDGHGGVRRRPGGRHQRPRAGVRRRRWRREPPRRARSGRAGRHRRDRHDGLGRDGERAQSGRLNQRGSLRRSSRCRKQRRGVPPSALDPAGRVDRTTAQSSHEAGRSSSRTTP